MHDRSLSVHDDVESQLCASAGELIAGLRSDDEVERVSTALLLAELGPGAGVAVPDLIATVEGDGSRESRWAAAYALGRIGRAANRAVPSLLRAVDDIDTDVRDEAVRALDAILAWDDELASAPH